ncbi:MAG: hypothetical protein EBR30_10170 [Cytophagia bacterium]|nr:hypothetical protein [Cytophagia bacterium]NBW35364.1 hypothetical protein [Cytophagia bacterium]
MDEATDYFLSFAFSIVLYKRLTHPELISFGLTTNRLNSFIQKILLKYTLHPKYPFKEKSRK